ncbi:MAG: DUF357 domain-containing protein [Candidatus Bathyarchaeia archaeon]|nr:DUF357 domain-containing protein [Candidatus Bathyarchaeota archaeon]
MNEVSIEERALKYILKAERVLKNMKISEGPALVGVERMREVVDEARRYFEDAKYYFDKKEYDVSLASIAYCEGLLDALRLLKLVEFEW